MTLEVPQLGSVRMPEQAPARLPHIHFDSRVMPSQTAVEFWRDSLSRSWEMSIDPRHAPDFHAEVSMWKLDELIVGTSVFGPVQARMRREKNIRSDQLDHYRLILLRDGEFRCDAGGRQVSLAPRRFVLTDMALPEANSSCCTGTIMYIPRELLERALPRAAELHGASPSNACAGLLADHLCALLAGLPEMSADEVPSVTRATVNLLAASLAMSPDNLDAARPAVDAVVLRRARKYIEDRLTDEHLGVQDICAHLRISRSGLYRLFDSLGGVANYVRERRLARVHDILSRSTDRQNIARLAEDHGFKTATHFSRAFRQQFGYSAREVQSMSDTSPPRAGPVTAGRFDHWLGTLYT